MLFEVKDTGIGIPAHQLHKIFEPFEQADNSLTRKYGGTGLGLSISARLVEMMGGVLEVESEPGRGSRFYFRVPFPLAAQPVPRATSDVVEFDGVSGSSLEEPCGFPRAARPARILLVEDQPDNQALTRDLLTRMGHRVTLAGNGRDALEVLTGAFDVVLMDVQMPELDGQEATKAIREGKGGRRDVPIVGISAHASDNDRDACLAGGMDDYLTKPCEPQQLFAAIERIRRREAGRPARPTTSVTADAELFNEARALAQFGGQAGLMREQAAKYLDAYERDLEAMHLANDSASLMRAAHRYQSSLACYFSPAVRLTARRINDLAKEGKSAEAAALVAQLQAQASELATVLQQWLRG